MKTFTRKEYRNAPNPAVGSASEQYSVDDEMMVCVNVQQIQSFNNPTIQPYMPRPYYSRPNRDDKDYFDFDLQHSVDM